MNKKGFTLIELLAVIVILGIILTFAIMSVSGFIEKAEKQTLIKQADTIIDMIKSEISSGEDLKDYYYIDDHKFVGENNFKFTGSIPIKGELFIDDEDVYVAVSDGYWCVKKIGNDNYDVTKGTSENCTIITPEECFVFDESIGEITDYLWCEEDVLIPKTINGVTVTSIGEGAFTKFTPVKKDEDDDYSVVKIDAIHDQLNSFDGVSVITSVRIPSTVTKIGAGAFSSNGIKEVFLSDSIKTVGKWAFANNGIEKIKLPNTITVIEDYSFYENNLSDISIPETVIKIGPGAFERNKLKSITLPLSLTTIEDEAFGYNELESITLPQSLTTIGNEAFSNNKLTKVVIPNSIIDISYGAFSYNQLENVKLPDLLKTISFCAFCNNALKSIEFPDSLTNIEASAFLYNSLTNVELPPSVTFVGNNSFANNNITSIIIPNSLNQINEGAFSKNKLVNLILPNSITRIYPGAFSNNNLENLIIPASVNLIENYAFAYNNLTSIIMDGPTSLSYRSFYKSSTSNSTLNSIIYKGTAQYNWNYFINGSSGTLFTTGTVTNPYGDVIISAN